MRLLCSKWPLKRLTGLWQRYMSLGIPGLDSRDLDRSTVSHMPVFSQTILALLEAGRSHKKKKKTYLDMTFGNGGHTSLILDHEPQSTVIAADRDPASYEAAEKMASRYPEGSLVPVQARFSQLPRELERLGIHRKSIHGLLIDTGVSGLQWTDNKRGFCPWKKGILDLRMDPDYGSGSQPTASEVLRHIDEKSLIRVLKVYGGLNQKARHVANAILEARYMFHHFQTTQELYEVICTASRNALHQPNEPADRRLTWKLMTGTLTALRMLVNNEINEFEFALNNVASNYLAEGGVVIAITYTEAERKVAHAALNEVQVPFRTDFEWNEKDVDVLHNQRPWEAIYAQPPLPLSEAEKTLNPRLQDAALFSARRTQHDFVRPVVGD